MIGQYTKRPHFTNNSGEDDCWVGHALDVADVGAVEVEELEDLLYLVDEFGFVLELFAVAREGAVEVLLDLDSNALLDPAFLAPLEELHVELPCYAQWVLEDHWPDGAAEFIWDVFSQQILCFVLEFSS